MSIYFSCLFAVHRFFLNSPSFPAPLAPSSSRRSLELGLCDVANNKTFSSSSGGFGISARLSTYWFISKLPSSCKRWFIALLLPLQQGDFFFAIQMMWYKTIRVPEQEVNKWRAFIKSLVFAPDIINSHRLPIVVVVIVIAYVGQFSLIEFVLASCRGWRETVVRGSCLADNETERHRSQRNSSKYNIKRQ